jgi:hypothetical protein
LAVLGVTQGAVPVPRTQEQVSTSRLLFHCLGLYPCSQRPVDDFDDALDDGYGEIAKVHGDKGAALAAEHHSWAIDRVCGIARELNIDYEYCKLPGYQISQYDRNAQPKEHSDDVEGLKAEVAKAQSPKMKAEYREGFAVKGWDSKPDQRDAFFDQSISHPTKYLIGILEWLKEQPNFTHSRVLEVFEKGISVPLVTDNKHVVIKTESDQTIDCKNAIKATCVPLQRLNVVAEMECMRTYCVAIKVPKGTVEDCLLYDSAVAYKATSTSDSHTAMKSTTTWSSAAVTTKSARKTPPVASPRWTTSTNASCSPTSPTSRT